MSCQNIEPPRRASGAGGFPSVGDWRRQERQEKREERILQMI
ncbi:MULTISPECIES: hypothetical protein [Brasilonema]|nr:MULTISPECIES: hypothetical protein [Brasilonema]